MGWFSDLTVVLTWAHLPSGVVPGDFGPLTLSPRASVGQTWQGVRWEGGQPMVPSWDQEEGTLLWQINLLRSGLISLMLPVQTPPRESLSREH